MNLTDDIQFIKGIGPERSKPFRKLGIHTVGDLLAHYPRAYEDRTRMVPIAELNCVEAMCFKATVVDAAAQRRIQGGRTMIRIEVSDGGSWLQIVFFNAPHVLNSLHGGETYMFYGRLEPGSHRPSMVNPIFEREETAGRSTGRILPIYPLTAGLHQWQVRAAITAILNAGGLTPPLPDILPEAIRQRYGLLSHAEAVRAIHRPETWADVESARRRLAFGELLSLTLGLRFLKKRQAGPSGVAIPGIGYSAFLDTLPFALTGAQSRAVDDIMADLSASKPMNRLVQGDVGSGKTLIAAAAAFAVVRAGYQAALLAPTEILAEQHHRSLRAWMEPLGVDVFLLTGSMGAKARKPVLGAIAEGKPALYIGTHALLSDTVSFARLGLVVTDEQHRFGVRQRARLAAGETPPHLLVMSATPIPRTLALLIHGDLDVSVVDELPPGRTPVKTFVVGEDKRERIHAFIRKLAGEGRQVFVVCPAVEDNEGNPDLRAVTSYAETLQTEVFPDLRIGLVHGKLAAAKKETIMRTFAEGGFDVLVASTVIEIGINVPNAALMVVENAERFGLSQLHQLRGRVGRGAHESFCVLFSHAPPESTAGARLHALASTHDGFAVAEEDLRLRGPGDFFGNRQHGLPGLRIADLCRDLTAAKQAAEAADRILADDPSLARAEHQSLRAAVQALFQDSWVGN